VARDGFGGRMFCGWKDGWTVRSASDENCASSDSCETHKRVACIVLDSKQLLFVYRRDSDVG
jgi:hypothetical protein